MIEKKNPLNSSCNTPKCCQKGKDESKYVPVTKVCCKSKEPCAIKNEKKDNACDQFIEFVKKHLPELATTKDLIKIGIFNTEAAASRNRRLGKGPHHFKINSRCIRFPKNAVIEYLERIKITS